MMFREQIRYPCRKPSVGLAEDQHKRRTGNMEDTSRSHQIACYERDLLIRSTSARGNLSFINSMSASHLNKDCQPLGEVSGFEVLEPGARDVVTYAMLFRQSVQDYATPDSYLWRITSYDEAVARQRGYWLLEPQLNDRATPRLNDATFGITPFRDVCARFNVCSIYLGS